MLSAASEYHEGTGQESVLLSISLAAVTRSLLSPNTHTKQSGLAVYLVSGLQPVYCTKPEPLIVISLPPSNEPTAGLTARARTVLAEANVRPKGSVEKFH